MAAKRKPQTSKSAKRAPRTAPKKTTVRKATPKKLSTERDTVKEETFQASSLNSKPVTNKLFIWLAVLLALAAVLYFARGLFVAALVNGSPITRYEVVRELEKGSGQQVLENLVTKNLIFQEMRDRNINVNEEDVDSEIEAIRTQVESQGGTLDSVLAEQGQNMESLRENVRIQKGIEEMFAGEVEVTQEEITNYYDQNKEFLGEGTLEEMSEQIRQQLLSQKLSTRYREWLTEVKANANIKYFVNY